MTLRRYSPIAKSAGTTWPDRFWAKVARAGADECWVWTGSTAGGGYGEIWRDGRKHQAHRVAYEMEFGPIPEGLIACHHCDNRPCVNPRHLFLGTHKDNADDRDAKGRRRGGGWSYAAGNHRGLPFVQVQEIRAAAAAGESQHSLARRYGVSRPTVARYIAHTTRRVA